MKKMNNKGFSLVELIVVVLIMAIIAVALAPQVMRWVENSRKATDVQNYGELCTAINTALTNEDVYDNYATCTFTKQGGANNWDSTITATSGDALTKFVGILNTTLGGTWYEKAAVHSKEYKAATLHVYVREGSVIRDSQVSDDIS